MAEANAKSSLAIYRNEPDEFPSAIKVIAKRTNCNYRALGAGPLRKTLVGKRSGIVGINFC
jgi:hypothetical protein